MATKKEIRGVIVPRHDTAINWSKAVNFTPENGELIIISADNATDVARGYYLDSEGNKLTSITVNSNGVNKVCAIKPSDKVRFKFGNGKDNVNALPFQTDALQDTASGSTILIDDISPVTHEMGVKVRSKNLIPYPYYNFSLEQNGVTATLGNDGSITLNGTATENVAFKIYDNTNGTKKDFIVKPGIKYTVSGIPNGALSTTYYLRITTINDRAHDFTVDNYTQQFNITEDTSVKWAFVAVKKGVTINNVVFKPQLELGTTATAYTPYEDLTAVKVTRCGKNLFDTINAVKLNGGSSFSITNNAITVSQNGNYNYASANVLIPQSLIGKIVTISAKSNTSGANVAGLRIQWVSDSGGATGDMILGRPDSAGNIVVTGTVPTQPDETHNNLCLMLYSNSTGTLETGTTYTATYSDIQIELGSTATDYEPYITPTDYTPNADGTVNGVTSLYPNTTLMTDTDGVIIDCEYLTKLYTEVFGSTNIKNESINIKNGSSIGSLRTIGSKEEDSSYTLGQYSVAEGYATEASGDYSHAEGYYTKASGEYSHAEGSDTTASFYGSHAEGHNTTASGVFSHAEGYSTTASGDGSHAEGYGTMASEFGSHAEGYGTIASNVNSHAEGYQTSALGSNSHAEGSNTTASGDYSHAQGRYNISNTNYADVIGNGSSDTGYSNAYTMDWSGNAWFAGDVYTKSTSGKNKDEGSKKLATEEYIDKKIEVSDTAPIEEENKIWLKPITDSSEYIIEEGTNGIWTYRIWSSGISECWGKQSISVTTSTSNNGYYTGKVGSLQYPSNLFISEPILNCTLKASSFPGHLFIDGTESSSYTGTISIAAHSNTTVNGYIHLSAKGRWK